MAHALAWAGLVLATVILVRFAWVMTYGLIVRRFRNQFRKRVAGGAVPSVRTGILVSWCGMRGLVTLATAFALPPQFPRRDVIVLAAFTVVLGTLVIQGFTIRPLIAWLKFAKDPSLDEEVAETRTAMLEAALASLENESGAASSIAVRVSATSSSSDGSLANLSHAISGLSLIHI